MEYPPHSPFYGLPTFLLQIPFPVTFSETSFSCLLSLSTGSFPLTFKHFHIFNMFKTKRSPNVCPTTLAHFSITTLFHFFPSLEQVVYTLLHFHMLLILLQSVLVHPQPPWNSSSNLLCVMLMSLGFHDTLLLVFFLLCLFLHSLFYGISLSLCCWSFLEFCPRSSSLLIPHTFPDFQISIPCLFFDFHIYKSISWTYLLWYPAGS